MDNKLTKQERLCGDKVISRLFDEGHSGYAFPFRYYWRSGQAVAAEADASVPDGMPGTKEDTAAAGNVIVRADGAGFPAVSVLFSVPKKIFRRAVKRNLLKRRAREAYRLNKSLLTVPAAKKGQRVELALIYTSKDISDFKTIENGIRRILGEIAKRL